MSCSNSPVNGFVMEAMSNRVSFSPAADS